MAAHNSASGVRQRRKSAGRAGGAASPSVGQPVLLPPPVIGKTPAQALPPELLPLFDAQAISGRIGALAGEIARGIPHTERPVAVVVLQGAFVFAADLLRCLPADYPIDVAFVRCSSYGGCTRSSGRVQLAHDIDASVDLRGRTVLLIDDILDTGLTTRFLTGHLRKRGAGKVRVCVLLHRHRARNGRRIRPDYYGFSVGPHFVVGYGLDYDGRYRHLPHLAALKDG